MVQQRRPLGTVCGHQVIGPLFRTLGVHGTNRDHQRVVCRRRDRRITFCARAVIATSVPGSDNDGEPSQPGPLNGQPQGIGFPAFVNRAAKSQVDDPDIVRRAVRDRPINITDHGSVIRLAGSVQHLQVDNPRPRCQAVDDLAITEQRIHAPSDDEPSQMRAVSIVVVGIFARDKRLRVRNRTSQVQIRGHAAINKRHADANTLPEIRVICQRRLWLNRLRHEVVNGLRRTGSLNQLVHADVVDGAL